MGFFLKLKAMIKVEYIQMKRNLFLSFTEIFSPIILLLFFLFIRLLFSVEKEKYDSLYKDDIEYIFTHSTNLTNRVNSDYKLEDIKKDENPFIPYIYFLKQCSKIKHIALIGENFPLEIRKKIFSHFWEFDDEQDIDPNKVFKNFITVDEFNDYISSKQYGKDENNPEICFGISQTADFHFGIHYKGINLNIESPNEIEELLSLETPQIPDTRMEKNEKIRIQENLKFFDQYKNSGYLMVMKIIYEYFLQKITGDPNAEIQFSLIGMKFDEILKDGFHKFLNLFGFFIIIGYSIPMSISIYKQVHLKESEKKDYFKAMGLTEIIFFLTYFIKSFIINIIHTIFNSLIANSILKQAQFGYLFLVFFFFGLVIFSMTYFFQSFHKISRLGVIISLLIYCIMSFVYLPMDSPLVNSSLRYFFCIIFPPTSLLLGLNSFIAFEKEFTPLDNRIGLDVAQLNIRNMIVLLFASFIFYIILSFFVYCACFRDKEISNENNNENQNDYNRENTSSSFNSNDRTEVITEKEKTGLSKEINSKPNKKNKYKIKKSEKFGNPPKKEIEIGEIYMDSNPEEENNKNYNGNININNNGNNNFVNNNLIDTGNNTDNNDDVKSIDIKIQYKDYIESKAKNQPNEILEKKLNNLRKSLWKKHKNKIEKNNTEDNPFFGEVEDEIEFDLDNQVELQKIRNLRRTVLGTMHNFKKEEESYEEDELKLSSIEYSLDESVKSSTENIINLIQEIPGKATDINFKKEIIPKNKDIKKKSFIPEINGQPINEEDEYKKKKVEKIDIGYIDKKKKEIKDCSDLSRIVVKNLTKIYENGKKKNTVLNNLSFKIYENDIFALLGQNGEGKSTFVSILSGLKEATSGRIRYEKSDGNNYEILSPKGIKSVRKILGICSQNNNILFNDLTVRENLEFFYELKYESNVFQESISTLLNDFKLDDKKDEKVGKLSGGYKRKLMIAISFCGKNEIIILDEPTGGIDIPGKREIWEILKEQKNNRIIILITHYMDEAFELADEIGILKDGDLIFDNTKERLMKEYAKYFKIQIFKKKDKTISKKLPADIESKFLLRNENGRTNTNNIISETGSNPGTLITNSETNSNSSAFNIDKVDFKEFKERVIIKVPIMDFNRKKWNELLDLLEKDYKVDNYYIDINNYDDIFVNAVKDQKENKKRNYMVLSEDQHYKSSYTGMIKFKNEIKQMFFKRFTETINDKKLLILEILFPIFLTLISCILCYFEILEDNKSVELFLYNMDDNQQSIFYEALNDSNYEEFGNVLSYEIKEEQKNLTNYWFQYIPNVLEEENDGYLKKLAKYYNVIFEYSKREGIKNNTGGFYFVKADKNTHKYEFNFYISSKKKHGAIFLTNYLLRSIIRYEMKRSSVYKKFMDDIQITNSPFPLTYEEKGDKKSRNGFCLVFFISIALSLIPANFITIILREKENKCKHLQMLSGTSIYTYWINNYIFEIVKYYIVVGICLLILFLFDFYEKYLVIIYIFYGPALISFTYFLSYFLETERSGQVIILLVNLFFGSLCGSAVLLLRTNDNLKGFGIFLSYLFRLVPSFCICYGYNQLISKKILFAIDYFDPQDFEKLKEQYFDSSYIITDSNYISSDIIFLSFEMVIYTLLLIFFENKEYFLWKFGFKKIDLHYSYNSSTKSSMESNYSKKDKGKTKKSIDSKNIGKTSKVTISKLPESKEYLFEVNKLSKSYLQKNYKNNLFNYILYKFCKKRKKEKCLDEISFQVSNGQCYGLLGGNGSGKTTSFSCFSKEINPDKGSIYVGGINIKDFTQKQPSIGYCPQFDCIFEYLTAKENLMFYAKLKGIRENSLELIVNILLDLLNLNADDKILAHYLSGGNKRKLSVGISLLCRPMVILMDEPSTGMDPYSRELLLDLLRNAYLKPGKRNQNAKKRGLVLVTHLIQEAELLSDKIGILHNGKIKADKKLSYLLKNDKKDIILSVEYKVPKSLLKKEFGDVLKEKVKAKEINKLLIDINREKYKDLITADKFGKYIYEGIKKRNYVKKISLFKLIKYLDFTFLLTKKLKKYFNSVVCINFTVKAFIFKIGKKSQDNICDSRLIGIIEECKEECHIDLYDYELNNLNKIFLDTIEKEDDLKILEQDNFNISF